jgi:hypothetical protein
MPTPLVWRKAASGRPLWRGRAGIAGVPSSGHAFQGNPQGPRRAPHLLLTMGGTGPPRETEGAGRDAEQSYEPMLPTKVGNRRAPARGRPRDPLEARGEQTDASVEDPTRPKVPMHRSGAHCFVRAMKRGNARGAKGAGHPRQDGVNGQPEELLVWRKPAGFLGVARAG